VRLQTIGLIFIILLNRYYFNDKLLMLSDEYDKLITEYFALVWEGFIQYKWRGVL
jgi:hypothetical protein